MSETSQTQAFPRDEHSGRTAQSQIAISSCQLALIAGKLHSPIMRLYRACLLSLSLLAFLSARSSRAETAMLSVPVAADRSIQASLRFPSHPPGARLPVILVFGGFEEAGRVLELFRVSEPVILASFAYPFQGERKLRFPRVLGEAGRLKRSLKDTQVAIPALISLLKERKDVDPERIAIVGASLGAPFALHAASESENISAVVLVHGFADIEGTLAHRLRAIWSHRLGYLSSPAAWLASKAIVFFLDPPVLEKDAAHLKSSQKVLVIEAMQDSWIPASSRAALWDSLRLSSARVERVQMPGDHLQPGADRLIQKITKLSVDWFKKTGWFKVPVKSNPPLAHSWQNRVNEKRISMTKPEASELRKRLTPEQYRCTQESGTERPFANAYWDNHRDGIYVDVVSGAPLFLSLDKFDSGTGWPSFTRPVEAAAVKEKPDRTLGVERTEIRSSSADSHLGHVFDDGPGPTGKRFCMNSAALKFVPLEEMSKDYGRYLFLFAEKKHWEIATLAGGCFWGMEDLIRQIPGVIETQAGYSGGKFDHASYATVKTGTTGHAESVQILFDPSQLTYEQLLLQFFKMHDPTTADRQGNDTGTQYRSAIFYASEEQKKIAENVKTRVDRSGKLGKPVVTQIVPFEKFWRAEDEHQKYLVKHPHGYTCHFIRKIDF